MLLRTFSTHLKVVARDAKEMCNTQDTRPGCVSCKSWRFYLFLVKKMIRFSTDYNIFLVTFVRLLKTEEVCACCYFCHMIDLTEHFIVKKVNSQNIKSYCFKMLGLELGY